MKASDEITSVALSQKESKDRYAGIVHQVVLRTLHEVFEADRRALIQSIALEVGTQTINPATGNETYIPFAAVGHHVRRFPILICQPLFQRPRWNTWAPPSLRTPLD
ncbi:hypothetical protein QFZ65_002583 [Arthrobacter sp. B3I9]|uniref:hypothetical protein n=1 Tax=Arthrobacter sp. B3I9 TaxID=3042270 RepID=UPI002794AAD2|nr:hypothetical protein [Arthrobacter sp. B3I9]MDQ0850645.1 hypothetical protein [Arthrobacter sp. B3I9]